MANIIVLSVFAPKAGHSLAHNIVCARLEIRHAQVGQILAHETIRQPSTTPVGIVAALLLKI